MDGSNYIVPESVFQKMSTEMLGGEEHPHLGCATSLSFGYYNLCDGAVCYRDVNCVSNCCRSYYNVCSSYWCDNGTDLAWLWWTIFGIFLCLCIMSMTAAAKRRRRQAMMMAAVAESAHHNANTSGGSTTVYYN